MYPYLNQPATNQRNAVFMMLIAKVKDSLKPEYRTMFVTRWDGSLGFPGGKTEGDETLQETLIRECIEEIGKDFSGTQFNYACTNILAAHMNTHCFYAMVTEDELFAIAADAGKFIIDNRCKELIGVCTPVILDMTPTVIVESLKELGAPTVYEEVVHVIHNVLLRME